MFPYLDRLGVAIPGDRGYRMESMSNLTSTGRDVIADLARRYNLSEQSATNMMIAVNNGGGTMAQFSCPELGSGQWMRGGMTMVGDMFNHGLKATVDNLCNELSSALANRQIFEPTKGGGSGGNTWWPGDLGSPSSTGSQNGVRYAVFPDSSRLVVENNGAVSVFDTLDHRIGGVSQQQGSGSSLTFSSQRGTLSTLSLPLIAGPGGRADHENFAKNPTSESASVQAPAQSASEASPVPPDVIKLLENLGQLRDAGILTEEEFASKKAEILSRI